MKDARSDAELNRVIAEWMGWTFSENGWCSSPDRSCSRPHAPNYCTDLNPFREAFCHLSSNVQKMRYNQNLEDILSEITDSVWVWLESATARQRAEALVAVIEANK